jgi:hypothetical protein
MAFITQYFKKMHRFEGCRSLGARLSELKRWGTTSLHLALLALLALLPLSASAQFAPAPTVQVADLTLERVDDAYLLSTTLGFELPTPVEEALNKGVALYFLSQAEVFKERWYWYEKSVALQERHYRLSYHPLSRQWRLLSSSKPIPNSGLGVTLGVAYDDLQGALFAVKRLSNWRLVNAADIESGAKYHVDFRFKLDLTQFPRPLQIGTLGDSEWNLSATKSVRLTPEPSK